MKNFCTEQKKIEFEFSCLTSSSYLLKPIIAPKSENGTSCSPLVRLYVWYNQTGINIVYGIIMEKQTVHLQYSLLCLKQLFISPLCLYYYAIFGKFINTDHTGFCDHTHPAPRRAGGLQLFGHEDEVLQSVPHGCAAEGDEHLAGHALEHGK